MVDFICKKMNTVQFKVIRQNENYVKSTWTFDE